MDDLALLRTFRDDAPDVPTPDLGRARLVRATHQRSPSRRPTRRSAAALVAAAGVGVLAVVGAFALQAGPGAEPSAAAVALNHAAHVVAALPFTPPRRDQWLHEGLLGVDPETGQKGTHPSDVWVKFDGTAFAELHEGHILRSPVLSSPSTPMDKYDELMALPSDPQAILQALRDGALGQEKGTTEADRDFDGITTALTLETAVPPEVQGHLFAALATIPGVGFDENSPADLVGRPVLSVTYTGKTSFGASHSRTELLLDPSTYAVLGLRETALPGMTSPKLGPIPAGTVWYNDAYLYHDVVDAPGDES